MYENIPSLLYYGGNDTDILAELGIPFDTPNAVNIAKEYIQSFTKHGDIILGFFSGSATTAHAVMQLNAEDGGKRKFIMVQLPEPCAPDSEAAKAGYANISEIGKERIRRAGEKNLQQFPSGGGVDAEGGRGGNELKTTPVLRTTPPKASPYPHITPGGQWQWRFAKHAPTLGVVSQIL
jgi:hypothetical protein